MATDDILFLKKFCVSRVKYIFSVFITIMVDIFNLNIVIVFITLNGVIVDVNVFDILEAVMSYTSAYFSCLFNL